MPKVSDDRGPPAFEDVVGEKPWVRKSREDRCRLREGGKCSGGGGSQAASGVDGQVVVNRRLRCLGA